MVFSQKKKKKSIVKSLEFPLFSQYPTMVVHSYSHTSRLGKLVGSDRANWVICEQVELIKLIGLWVDLYFFTSRIIIIISKFFFGYKIEFLLQHNLSIYVCETPFQILEPRPLPPISHKHPTSTYTCEVTIALRVCGGNNIQNFKFTQSIVY